MVKLSILFMDGLHTPPHPAPETSDEGGGFSCQERSLQYPVNRKFISLAQEMSRCVV
jgi:hypothetical protein